MTKVFRVFLARIWGFSSGFFFIIAANIIVVHRELRCVFNAQMRMPHFIFIHFFLLLSLIIHVVASAEDIFFTTFCIVCLLRFHFMFNVFCALLHSAPTLAWLEMFARVHRNEKQKKKQTENVKFVEKNKFTTSHNDRFFLTHISLNLPFKGLSLAQITTTRRRQLGENQ